MAFVEWLDIEDDAILLLNSLKVIEKKKTKNQFRKMKLAIVFTIRL